MMKYYPESNDPKYGEIIRTATAKATPVDADKFTFLDSVTGLLRSLTWANIKTTLGSTFAALAGLSSQTFSASPATASTHVVVKSQADATTNAIGYVVESVAGATNAPTSTAWGDLTSLVSLPIGTWDISVTCLFSSNGATVTNAYIGISLTTGNFSTGLVIGDTQVPVSPPTSSYDTGAAITPKRFVLVSPTTIYFKIQALYSVATPRFSGRITAVRAALT